MYGGPISSSKGKGDLSLWQKVEVMRPLGALVLSIGAALAVGAAVTITLPFVGIPIAASMATLLAITIPITVGGTIVGILGIYLLSKPYLAKPEPKVEPKKPEVAPPPPCSPPPSERPSSSTGSDSEKEVQKAANIPPPSKNESSDEESPAESDSEVSSLKRYDLLETLKKHVGMPELKFSTVLTAPSKQKQYTIQRDSFISKIKSYVEGLTTGEVEIVSAASQKVQKFQGELTHPAQFGAILAFAQEQLEAFNTQLRAEKEKDSTLNVELIDIEKFMADRVPLLDSYLEKYRKDLQESISRDIQTFINQFVPLGQAIKAIEAIKKELTTKCDQVKNLNIISLIKSEQNDLSKIEILLNQLSLVHNTEKNIEEKIKGLEEFSQSLPLAGDTFWTEYPSVHACLRVNFCALFDGSYFANYRFCTSALIVDDGIDHRDDTEKKRRLQKAVQKISLCLNIDPPEISAENDTSADAILAQIAQDKEFAERLTLDGH